VGPHNKAESRDGFLPQWKQIAELSKCRGGKAVAGATGRYLAAVKGSDRLNLKRAGLANPVSANSRTELQLGYHEVLAQWK
jgi:hypothetical protein